MYILCYGASHHKTPFHHLEALSFNDEQLRPFLQRLHQEASLTECLALSTCNRVEFYLRCDAPGPALLRLEALLREHVGPEAATDFPWESTYRLEGAEALRHLFEVACGVDSLVVGEHQILTQIRDGHDRAEAAGVLGRQLDRLTHVAIRLGRRVRRETRIARGNVSVPKLALQTARRTLEQDFAQSRALVIGAGRTATIAAQLFTKSGLREVRIVNRSRERAGALADELGLCPEDFDDLPRLFGRVDIVVAATAAQRPIVTPKMLEPALAARNGGPPLVLIDLAMPRNIDPAVAELPGARLFAMENLEERARENRERRRAELDKVRSYVETELRQFLRWRQGAENRALTAALRQHFETIRREKIERHATTLEPDEQERLDRFSDSLVRSLLHNLTTGIRSIDPATPEGQCELDTLRRLFQLHAKRE